MLAAKDIMVKDVISVKKNTPIHEAMELLAIHNISGMPVVDKNNVLIAILSEKDVLSLFYSPEDLACKAVDDFMTQPAVHFEQDESLLDICDFLTKNIFRRVPITLKEKLVGIISIKDLLKYTLELSRERAASAG